MPGLLWRLIQLLRVSLYGYWSHCGYFVCLVVGRQKVSGMMVMLINTLWSSIHWLVANTILDVYMSRYVCMHVYDVCSLISRPTLLFVIRLAFSIIHGSGGMAKNGEGLVSFIM